eukprot:CAMPEP_0178936006 /NCGR_PEP_ID=MMETSP0786-20121207/24892_1 /TAXON_ID=186022 /ORGANISM="Thalassionema frauenfeldii, Strain CCMP 1798" /LENGTH=597 /DNA_ID=CAMNT_0020614279 /DNA_START=41 /DNA_END=1834 /DNA_ORIENTATION=+
MKNSTLASAQVLFLLLIILLSGTTLAFTGSRISHHASLQSSSQFISPIMRSSTKNSSPWQMHMGHSHAHNHHHTSTSSSAEKKIPMKRKVARILFAAVVTLLPPLLWQGKIRNKNTILFLLTSTALSCTERLRSRCQLALRKAQTWRDGVLKHAPASRPTKQRRTAADRVTLLGVLVNLVLSAGKAAVGLTCHSSALIADAGHSLSDLFSDFITLWAVQIARLPPDDDHPYGHGKFEAVGSLFLALTLFGTGISVGTASNSKLLQIWHGTAEAAVLPTWPALVMAAISIGSKEWLYRITRKVGEAMNSQVVLANAWHHRSDAYSSILALGSIALAIWVQWPAADAAAGLLVAGMICMTGAEILTEAVKQLTDTTDPALEHRVQEDVMLNDDVVGVPRIRTRWMGSKALVDVSLQTPKGVSPSANKAIENRVKQALLEHERGVLVDAEVRATPQDEVTFCPLLLNSSSTGKESVTHVEEDARRLLLSAAASASSNDIIGSIASCTVRYEDSSMHAVVDATIRVQPHVTELQEVTRLASTLRAKLEQESYIHKANIYLDLNENDDTPTNDNENTTTNTPTTTTTTTTSIKDSKEEVVRP